MKASRFGLILAGAHLIAFIAGTALQFPVGGYSAFWAPAGVGFVALLLAPYRWWYAIIAWLTLVDTVATYLMFDVFTWPDDSIKTALAALVLRQLDKRKPYQVDSVRSYLLVLVSCTVCFGAVTFFSAPARSVWLGYWMGDLLGVTMVTPLVFLRQSPQKGAARIESYLTVALILLLTQALFMPPGHTQAFATEFPYLLFPFLLWISIRLPDRMVALSTIGVAAIAVFLTGQSQGPFLALPISSDDQLLMMQSYLLMVTTGPVLLSLGLFERKKAQGENRKLRHDLQQSSEVYRHLFETSGVGIGVLKERSIIQMNRRLLQLLEPETEEDLLSLAPPTQKDGRKSEEVALELHQESEVEPVATNWTAQRRDGQSLELALSMFALPGTREKVMMVMDVTESSRLLSLLNSERDSLAQRVGRRSAELRKANQNLEEALQTQREFVANLSHELKTPLTALLAQSETLLEELYGPLSEKQREAITEIRDNGKRLSRLILDLLDLHRLESQKAKVQNESINLTRLLQGVAQNNLSPCQLERLRVEVDVEKASDLRSDSLMLRRALAILVGRAARQTPRDQSFGIRMERWDDLQKLDLVIWDRGPQLSETSLKSLKNPYEIKPEGENRAETGLSLAVANGIANFLGGSLDIRSSKQGTLMTLTLPLLEDSEGSVS